MASFAGGSAGATRVNSTASVPNLDVSQRHFNESEEAVAVNPTNPQNVVIVTNVDNPAAGLFKAVSFDGGATWTTSLIGDNDNLGAACCDPTLSFDKYGNLFLSYLYNVGNVVPVALSTDGGVHFTLIANIAKPASANSQTSEERRELSSGPFFASAWHRLAYCGWHGAPAVSESEGAPLDAPLGSRIDVARGRQANALTGHRSAAGLNDRPRRRRPVGGQVPVSWIGRLRPTSRARRCAGANHAVAVTGLLLLPARPLTAVSQLMRVPHSNPLRLWMRA